MPSTCELFLRNTSGFRKLALDELPKRFRRQLARKAAHLAEGITAEHFRVMDFYFEGDDRSFHVLSAVSPGFTCTFAFSSFLIDEIQQRAA